jgi:hypothetical protein
MYPKDEGPLKTTRKSGMSCKCQSAGEFLHMVITATEGPLCRRNPPAPARQPDIYNIMEDALSGAQSLRAEHIISNSQAASMQLSEQIAAMFYTRSDGTGKQQQRLKQKFSCPCTGSGSHALYIYLACPYKIERRKERLRSCATEHEHEHDSIVSAETTKFIPCARRKSDAYHPARPNNSRAPQ